MVVDDDAGLRRSVARQLRTLGADCVQAATVGSALSADRENIDGWIVDWKLPDGKGTSLLHILQAEGAHGPALLITGDPSVSLAGQGAAVGAVFHGKPVGPDALVAFVRTARQAIPIPRQLAWELGLTEREAAVIALRFAGVCRAGLAQSLGITEDAVKSRVRAILKKARETGHACDSLDDLMLDAHRPGNRP